ncbi:PKD domain-containing protein [uncultured Roseibium sp.]|uniref:PKD domain-containing protein n=1 Tax=uncultured Roseibium sp. TaxID=1936171 RepID=UPI00260BFAA9|nr:PKD domain-containing protein [uncultured Roseibium sp.]
MANNFPDTLLGKLIVGAVLAIFSAIVGGVATWVNVKDARPVINLAPEVIVVDALEPAIFSAEGSHDPEGEELAFAWSLNGQSFGSSPVASCSETPKPAVVSCRFSMPGTHAVTVAATDPNGLVSSMSSTVQVKLENGYLGLLLSLGNTDAQTAIETAILYGIDWVGIQSLVSRPIILNDPSLKSSVYAALYQRDVERAKAALENASVSSIKVTSFGLQQAAKDQIQIQAAEVGLDLGFLFLPAGEVYPALIAGAGEGGFLTISSPGELQNLMQ